MSEAGNKLSRGIALALGGRSDDAIAIPSAARVHVARRSLRFTAGDPDALPPDTPSSYANKPLVDVARATLYPELAVVRLFRRAGWEAYWLDGYARGGWVADGDLARQHVKELPAQKPPPPVLKTVADSLGGWSGCWDVVAWKGDQLVFAECKERGKGKLTDTQCRWLLACLDAGIPVEAFVVVEHAVTSSTPMAYHAARDD